MALSFPWSFYCAKRAPIYLLVRKIYNNNGLCDIGGTDISRFIKYVLSKSKAFWHWSSHLKIMSLCNKWMKGTHFFASWEMKWRTDWSLPWREWRWLRFFGGCMVTMAYTFSGSTSIPLAEIMYPRSFPYLILKAHFFGFSLTLNASKRVNILFEIGRCSSQVWDLARISST